MKLLMPETVPAADESNANRGLRWSRLFAVFLWNFGFFFVGSLIGEFSWDVWKYGLGSVTIYVVLAWLGRSLGFGLFCGFFIAFSTWLAREIFGSSKKDSSQRPGA
jgi:hypothetical protein